MSIKGFRLKNGTTAKYDYNELDNLPASSSGSGLSEEAKLALLTLLENVAYVDSNGQTYYHALEAALYPPSNLVSISAAFDQGAGTIYDNQVLNDLRQYLTVTARYDDATSETITSYALSGSLTAGQSVITVNYMGKTDTFTATVTAYPVPDGYTLRDYIYNNVTRNTQTDIDTGLSGTYCGGGYEHEITFALETAPSSTGKSFCGLRDATGQDPTARVYWLKTVSGTANNIHCDYYGTGSGYLFACALSTKYKSVTKNGQWLINDTLVCDNMEVSGYTPATRGTLRLFGCTTNNAVGQALDNTVRIYGFKVKNISTGEYVCDMIPCVNSTNVAGFYDTVREQFYTATNSSLLSGGFD